jgi:hypothetical protein
MRLERLNKTFDSKLLRLKNYYERQLGTELDKIVKVTQDDY